MAAAAKKAAEVLARLLKKLIEDPEGSKEGFKKVLFIIIGIVFSLILISVSAFSLPGLISKGIDSDKDMETITFNSIEDSKVFNKVKDVYLDYNEDLDKTIEEHIQKIKEDNTYTKTVTKTDSETGETTTVEETVVPEIIKDVNITKPKIQYVFAYISAKYIEYQTENDAFEFDKNDIKKFFTDITTLVESTSGKDPIYYYAYTTILNENEIAKKYFPNENSQELYLISYESFMDIVDDEIQESYENIDLSTLTIHANGMQIPHYLQYDSKWGNERYGSGTLSQTACGPTSFAMVASYLNNEFVSPLEVARWSESNGYYVWGAGTSWSMFSGASANWNISNSNLGKNAKLITKALSEGHPVIASMGRGTFTKNGHYIVLRGITAEGKILVNDANDNFYSKNFYQREFDLSLILNEAKNFWSFSK